jgi:hypothetical protein
MPSGIVRWLATPAEDPIRQIEQKASGSESHTARREMKTTKARQTSDYADYAACRGISVNFIRFISTIRG